MSFVSTAHAILYNGGKPAFADVSSRTLCLNPKTLPYRGNTAAIIPVHFGGMECEVKKAEVPIIEDSAHRIKRGCVRNNITCFSFHPVKNLSTLGGGAIAANVKLDRLRDKRWCGITDRVEQYYDVKEIGWNYYMSEVSAAIGLVQLERLDMMNKRRQEIAYRYRTMLEYSSMQYEEGVPYHLYWIRVKHRPKFIKKMTDAGIEVGIHYHPIDQMSMYNKVDLPVTDKISEELVTLPMHTRLTDQDVDSIIKVANS
jgi:perosamine synthetase